MHISPFFSLLFVLLQNWLQSLCFLQRSCSTSLHGRRSLPVWRLQARDWVTGAASADFWGKNHKPLQMKWDRVVGRGRASSSKTIYQRGQVLTYLSNFQVWLCFMHSSLSVSGQENLIGAASRVCWCSGCLPSQKVKVTESCTAEGHRILMKGSATHHLLGL